MGDVVAGVASDVTSDADCAAAGGRDASGRSIGTIFSLKPEIIHNPLSTVDNPTARKICPGLIQHSGLFYKKILVGERTVPRHREKTYLSLSIFL